MKFNRSLFIAFCALACVFGFGKISRAAPPIVMGYYPSYRSTPAPTEIRFDRFSHIIHSFVTADADGKMSVPIEIRESNLIAQAHAKNAKVLLALGGGNNGKDFGNMVRSSQKSAQFINDVVKLMTELKADGLALDWELPEGSDKVVTVEFVTSLRKQMKAAAPDSLLILVVSAIPNNSHGYDGPKPHDKVDYLHIMAYDFHGPWSHAGHNASLFESKADTEDGKLFSFPASLAFWRDVQKFQPSQIIFGLAGYGRGFKVQNWGEKAAAPSKYPELTFVEARALIGQGWTRQWDFEARVPWLLSDDKSDRISYDDEQSVADKARWMKENGLPGFFIWELSQEWADGDNLLTAAAQKAWNEIPAGK